MILEIEGKRYRFNGFDPSIEDIMTMQMDLIDAPFTRCRTADDVARLEADLSALSPSEQARHPEQIFYSCVSIWLAMRTVGQQFTLRDVTGWSAAKRAAVRFIQEPADHQDAEGKAQSLPKGSGQGGANRPRKGGKRK